MQNDRGPEGSGAENQRADPDSKDKGVQNVGNRTGERRSRDYLKRMKNAEQSGLNNHRSHEAAPGLSPRAGQRVEENPAEHRLFDKPHNRLPEEHCASLWRVKERANIESDLLEERIETGENQIAAQYEGQRPNGPQTSDTVHDWFAVISASPDSIGAKTLYGLYVELEYL